MPDLAVTVPGALLTDGSRLHIHEKTLSGLSALAEAWPGNLIYVTEYAVGEVPSEARPIADIPFPVVLSNNRAEALANLKPDLVMAGLARSELAILESNIVPVVVVAENGLRGRQAWAAQTSPRGRLTFRELVGLRILEHRYRKIIRRAVGVQFNGYPAAYAYQHLNPNSLVYFDSRVTHSMVKESLRTRQRPSRGFRFAFSGRWLAAKGFPDAVKAFQLANDALDGSLTLELFGDGPLRRSVPKEPSIVEVGMLHFRDEWVPRVRNHVDALLVPHTQPDPACTYLEGVGLGAPFLSYSNAAAQALAEKHGLGWTAPLGDIKALAALIVGVATDSESLERRRTSGLRFMLEHSFEREFARRAEHLFRCHRDGR